MVENTERELQELASALRRKSRRVTMYSIVLSVFVMLIAALWLYGTIEKVTEVQSDLAKAQQVVQGASQKAAADPSTESALQEAAKSVDGVLSVVPPKLGQQGGYLVVLGSFRDIAEAAKTARALRKRLREDVRVFYAVNDYYAPAIGVIGNKSQADQKRRQVQSVVPDAYVFTAAAFPYEIKLRTE